MKNLEKIKINHEAFKRTNDAVEKLSIAAKNAVIQFKAVKESIEELNSIAESMGYKIDKEDGSLNAL